MRSPPRAAVFRLVFATRPSRNRPAVLVVAGLTVSALLADPWPALGQAPASPASSPPTSSYSYDPYAAYVAEASRRFGVPEAWIRAVMRVESAGNPSATSHAGAMGLMQVMPGTYAELRARYGLGPNAYDPRDSILAGTAYLREMHDRYGSAGFLAAYNAGPGRWEDYAYRRRPLPAETVAYMARLAPLADRSAAPSPAIAARLDPLRWTQSALFIRTAHRSVTASSDAVDLQSPRSPAAASVTTVDAVSEASQQATAPANHPLFAVTRSE